jgi:serine O-acetyltransferase
MSSKLAQFLHTDRYQAATIVLHVPQVRRSVDELLCLIFPQRGCLVDKGLEGTLAQVSKLEEQFAHYIESVAGLDPSLKGLGRSKALAFFEGITSLVQVMDRDVEAAFQGDPAAYSKEEVIITYPGFYAISIYRLANALHKLHVPLIPRLMSEYAHEKTGIDIHPGAIIDEGLFIDHGTGVVIGETSHIGKNVKIYQGVTLGALSVKKKLQSTKRHPTIEDDVVIYANATILGGDTIVGKGSMIGGNVWITQSVSPGSIITLMGK